MGSDMRIPLVSIVSGVVALFVCSIPFVPPLTMVAIPSAFISIISLLIWLRKRIGTISSRIAVLIGILLLNAFSLYLACNDFHLIDWIES